jgi:16S rRNA G966 N2-methylase RsmD
MMKNLIVAILLVILSAGAQGSFSGTLPAPEFPEGLEWLNSDKPLSLESLRGKIQMIYIDPPFDVGADFSMNIEIGEEKFTKQP